MRQTAAQSVVTGQGGHYDINRLPDLPPSRQRFLCTEDGGLTRLSRKYLDALLTVANVYSSPDIGK